MYFSSWVYITILSLASAACAVPMNAASPSSNYKSQGLAYRIVTFIWDETPGFEPGPKGYNPQTNFAAQTLLYLALNLAQVRTSLGGVMVDPNWKVPRFPYQSIAPEKTVIFHLQITNWEDKCGPQYCFAHARVDRSVNPPRFMGSINESEGNLVASWSIPIIPGGEVSKLMERILVVHGKHHVATNDVKQMLQETLGDAGLPK